jgi:tyrosyl-tRNA synthetase
MATNAFDELKWRDMIFDYVEGVQDLLINRSITLYNGFDATADSLHIGHLVPLLALARLQRFGHNPIALAGGGTSMIGDPSGKNTERQLLTREQIDANVDSIKGQLARFLDFEVKGNPARVMNNANWLLSLNLVNFLREVGKHFTVNYMIAKDSVKARLDREEGISFTEFSYMLLQSYDFLHLYETENCLLQTGGSDQWGNITAGVELIRRSRGKPAYGLVYPLVTKADGTKFGKTEAGAVWLAAHRTSPYRFYQFWLNTDDKDVVKYLKIFTFLDQPDIAELEQAVNVRPESREAQRRLAQEMTRMVHDETALARAEQATQVLFGEEITGLSGAEIQDIFSDVPSSEMSGTVLEGDGLPVLDLLTSTGLVKSKGEGRRAVSEGGIYVNNRRIGDPNQVVGVSDTIDGNYIVIRRGRRNYHLVRLAK